MSTMSFRLLRADEIDVRVGQQKPSGVALLLYKDARCDMSILDETVGPMNWMRSHRRENANCTVSIYDDEKSMWISKEDTGTESNTEAQKGLASDSFKRACVNWGIGRELYSAPFIWVPADKLTFKDVNGKKVLQDRFSVGAIEYDECRRISKLVICSDKQQAPIYTFPLSLSRTNSAHKPAGQETVRKQASIRVLEALGIDKDGFAGRLNEMLADGTVSKKPNEMSDQEYKDMCQLMIERYATEYQEAVS